MQVDIDGVRHRIRFNHRMEFKTLPPAKGKERKVPVPFSVKAQMEDGDEHFKDIRQARAVTACQVITGTKPNVQIVRSALAVCSWSEPSWDKEFARQLALARVLEGLPREVGGPLLGAYLNSGRRTLRDLYSASHGKYKDVTAALPKKVENEQQYFSGKA